jgi:hypothetical protein
LQARGGRRRRQKEKENQLNEKHTKVISYLFPLLFVLERTLLAPRKGIKLAAREKKGRVEEKFEIDLFVRI